MFLAKIAGRSQPSARHFGAISAAASRVLNTADRSTTAYSRAKYDPTRPLEGHEPIVAQEQKTRIQSTYLSNGFTVVTENSVFPSTVNMGVVLDVGSRDETSEFSGACQALQNVQLKTLRNTNETMNYGMMQMSGGDFNMLFDREKMYWSTRCVEYNVEDIFNVILDCALEPRGVFAGNIARAKNRKTHQLIAHLEKVSDPFIRNSDLLFTTAYGYNTLGMPLAGLGNNVENIDAKMLQDFVMNHVIPEKVVIAASGVKNHQEFVELVVNRIDEYPRSVPLVDQDRTPAKYIGGESRTWRETPSTNVMVAFQSAPWTSQDFPYYFVLSHLIGDASGFSAGGPGKGMHNRSNVALSRYPFLDSMAPIHHTFSDSGLFGINVIGASSHSPDLMAVAIHELQRLGSDISDEEFQRAVNQLTMQIMMQLQNEEARVEEAARSVHTFGRADFNIQLGMLHGLEKEKLMEVARNVLKGKPTIVVTGSAINLVPSYTEVQRQIE